MRTTRASDTEVVIIATLDELADLRSALAQRHSDFCASTDDCKCYGQVEALADPV